MLKSLLSLALLCLFLWGVGQQPFFPSFRLIRDTEWNLALFFPIWGQRLLSLVWVFPLGLGFLGWSRLLRVKFFSSIEKGAGTFLGLSLTLALFSLYVFSLGINDLLYWYLTSLFFIPFLGEGWTGWKEMSFGITGIKGWGRLGLAPALLWAFEYFSPPLAWDAILDHFRYAREVSRLHQIPFHWVNHTGDMPKASELILAGFWNMGGETLSKISLVLPAFFTGWLLTHFTGKRDSPISAAIFWTCPFFFALYSWGYVEGYLAFFEVLAVFCFWKALLEPKNGIWLPVTFFFLGTAFAIKYTAIFAIGSVGFIVIRGKFFQKKSLTLNPSYFLFLILPIFPWLFKNWLAFGNPFYPLMTSAFGSVAGYSPEMEQGLLIDTGLPLTSSLLRFPQALWNSFFTTSNAVNAALTPLVVMSLPWMLDVFKKRLGSFLFSFSVLFFTYWFFASSSFRHASGGTVVLALLAAMAWEEAFKEKGNETKLVFGLGAALSLWLCLSAQLTTTAPYASALGLEDPQVRLKKHYSYDFDTYTAFRGIEAHSEPRDKVVAFAVFQTYYLNRTAFVDFKWKMPIFLRWASKCQTAEGLSSVLKKEGVVYFLYQRGEAEAMSKLEKDFRLEGMPQKEYERFWSLFMEQVYQGRNCLVYKVLDKPSIKPWPLTCLPGVWEKLKKN